MPLRIAFDAFVDDGFDDDRCHVVIGNASFRGEARYRNRSPGDFAALARDVVSYPIETVIERLLLDGLMRFRLEPIGTTGELRLQLRLAAEIDHNEVCIETHVTYHALRRFAEQLSRVIEQDEGSAEL